MHKMTRAPKAALYLHTNARRPPRGAYGKKNHKARRKGNVMFYNGNNNGLWIIILIIILFGCNGNGCGCDNGNGCGCGC